MVIWELFSLLGLFALRIGVPLAAVGLVTWWLTRLDRKWQSEPINWPSLPNQSTEDAVDADRTTGRSIIQVPCWVFRACPPERCAKCRVYQAQDQSQPCWRCHLTQEGRLPARCRTCAIFATTVPNPVNAGAD